MRAFYKCKLRGGSPAPMGVHYKQKCVAFLRISAVSSVINARPRTRRRATHDCVYRRRRRFCLSHVGTDATTSSYRSVFCETTPALDAAVNFCRAMLCISAAYAVMRCLSVCHVRELCVNE